MRLCSGAGCGRAIPSDVRFCDECKADRGGVASDGIKQHSGSNPNSYNPALDALRKGTRWQRRRELVLKKSPFCARCQTARAEIVDHIVPAIEAIRQVRESKRYPLDMNAGYYLISNLQGLCRPCHGEKTTEDKNHTGPWPDVVAAEAARPKKVYSF